MKITYELVYEERERRSKKSIRLSLNLHYRLQSYHSSDDKEPGTSQTQHAQNKKIWKMHCRQKRK
ncbi:hypothetical protein HHI36_024418, partial [Cryptolaemus montrouzieri]